MGLESFRPVLRQRVAGGWILLQQKAEHFCMAANLLKNPSPNPEELVPIAGKGGAAIFDSQVSKFSQAAKETGGKVG